MTVDETTRYLAPLSETRSTRSTTAWTATETWLVSPRLASSSSSEMDVDGVVECPRPGTEEAGAGCGATGDGRCEAVGLRVGCQGRQCEVRGGMWWCLRMEAWEWVAEEGRRMGRVCWGGAGRVRQLGEACRVGDGGVGCPGCDGGEGWVGVDLG